MKNNNNELEHSRHIIRMLKVLYKRKNTGCSYFLDDKNIILELADHRYRFSLNVVEDLKQQKFISASDKFLKLTEAGASHLKQKLNPEGLLASSQNVIETAQVVVNNEHQQVHINTNESPLMRLFARKTKTGAAYISVEEFQAGERLRKDFERGQLQPKISASVQSSVGSTGKSGFSDKNDITDFAIDARKRVGNAIEKLGPELSGATIYICCFLKGLEQVERERRWPPRSAKLMLKTALSLLARHYGISGYENRSSNRNHTWGSADYRPQMNVTS